ncbi:MAG: hypothetical protein ACLFR0_02955 [Alphaproteobacteria bacterium]
MRLSQKVKNWSTFEKASLAGIALAISVGGTIGGTASYLESNQQDEMRAAQSLNNPDDQISHIAIASNYSHRIDTWDERNAQPTNFTIQDCFNLAVGILNQKEYFFGPADADVQCYDSNGTLRLSLYTGTASKTAPSVYEVLEMEEYNAEGELIKEYNGWECRERESLAQKLGNSGPCFG